MQQKFFTLSGWIKALLFMVAGFALSFSIALVAGFVSEQALVQPVNIDGLTAYYLLNTAGFVVAALAMQYWLDKQPLHQLGFAVKAHGNDALAGVCTALVILSVGTLVLIFTGHLLYTTGDVNTTQLLHSLLFCIIVAFVEELIFRGYLLKSLLQSFAPWLALTLSAVAFGLFHASNPNAEILPIVNVLIAGFLLGINYVYTRNLWFGIALHFVWNFVQGPVLGYNVSGITVDGLLSPALDGPDYITGGAFGFEGSVVTLTLQIIMVVFLWLVYTKKQQSVTTAA